MPTENNATRKNGSGITIQVAWFLVCLTTLGFPVKYRERLRLFENLFPLDRPQGYDPWSDGPTYSDRGSPYNSLKSMRQKQQEEWDRLNIAMSVITATSATALAIEATSDNISMYWLVTVFYSIAFGLSLEGLILITYMTISAGGSSDEAITRLARGILVPAPFPMVKLVALVMALPTIMATYSSIYLLLGLFTMVVAGPSESVGTRSTTHTLIIIIPVGVGFSFLCTAIALCEIGNWIEIWARRRYRHKYLETNFGDKPYCRCRPKERETIPHNLVSPEADRAASPPSHSRTTSVETTKSEISNPILRTSIP
ncbi:hypothetical protein B0J17DRAFT_681052 [Rhizoctonia solani]|nr:hypothetical protein B0J17DRAFT_681052 [Rhizoctonia solani]